MTNELGTTVTEIFNAIMNVYSVSDSETELADAVEKYLLESKHLEVRRYGDTVVASTNFGKSQRVILAGHIDVVPVIDNFPPLLLSSGDERIRADIAQSYPQSDVVYGRGATDMKASDAAFLYLAREIDCAEKTAVDITYVFYDHEEVQAEKNGLGRVVAKHPDWIRGDFAIIGEPTNGLIEGGCNGTMRFDIVLHGVAAHSARAWMGDNAIHHAAHVLTVLDSYQPATINVDGLDFREGLNATMISGGEGTNIIPQECRIHINYRFAPDKTIEEAKRLLMGESCASTSGVNKGIMRADGGLFEGYDIEMKDESSGARPGLTSEFGQSLVQLVHKKTGKNPTAKFGWTDVARFSDLNIPAVNLGAGNPLLAHKSDEQIALQAVEDYTYLLREWLLGKF
ncbi:succinyl-diaminopimelate desuccinylase [Alloscardovia theropitheci]|uniref:Succinyl-diaminopimelate desuccinylase n=1 Tax=Alloscardovia theropitheci TaxID=2496842 RepID=A0A4R0QSR1_9BIFI|nr:succinyl-diaminopimelate desuccinylase [Alloscardovia theropitheci]TCD54508.1 succinyl-diaminopimelate desuccinylase [Alloscardovia theropitheci]